MTAEEVRQDYIDKMGEELGAQFNRLTNECAWVHLKWGEYVALFGDKESRVDLLNVTARGFFGMVQTSLWEDVLLHICRITDDPEVGRRKRQTLSIRRLPTLVDASIEVKVRRLVSAAVKKSEFARDCRDRHIAHRDLKLALKQGATPLAPASRRGVKDAIAAIVATLGTVEQHYRKSETLYEHVSQLGDAVALLHVLRGGIEAREDMFRRLKDGSISPGEVKLNWQV